MSELTFEYLAKGVKWNEQGLVPAVVQDAVSKEVLMLAYMNRESLRLTLESGETWFWSRSRSELWHKGATSGHIQKVRSLRYDCDGDTLLVQVEQTGPACHTGAYSCFFSGMGIGDGEAETKKGFVGADDGSNSPAGRFDILDKLEAIIARRDAERPEGAYTTYLFDKGVDKILKKIGEEAGEVIIAAKNRSPEELRYEAADLIFHLMVLLREQKLPLDDVLAELARRHLKQKSEYAISD